MIDFCPSGCQAPRTPGIGLAYGGYLLGQNWERIREAMRPFDIPIVAVFLVLVAFFVWHRLRAHGGIHSEQNKE
jgi:hypothetical protein